MEVAELDRDLRGLFRLTGEHVATLVYGNVRVKYTCAGSWACYGESRWLSPASGNETVTAQMKVTRLPQQGRIGERSPTVVKCRGMSEVDRGCGGRLARAARGCFRGCRRW